MYTVVRKRILNGKITNMNRKNDKLVNYLFLKLGQLAFQLELKKYKQHKQINNIDSYKTRELPKSMNSRNQIMCM